MLDDFSAVNIDAKKADVSAAGPGRPSSSSASAPAPAPAPGAAAAVAPLETMLNEDAFSEDDFAKQLQAGMAELMGEIDGSVIPLPPLRISQAHNN